MTALGGSLATADVAQWSKQKVQKGQVRFFQFSWKPAVFCFPGDAEDCVFVCVLVIYHQIIMHLFTFGSLWDFVVLKIKPHDASGLAKNS